MVQGVSKSPHVTAAKKYARDVVSGKIDACKYVILAAQRFLDELEAAKGDEYPHKFIPSDVEHFCDFMESLPHVKGHWAVGDRSDPKSTLLRMEPFQCFIAASIFGWRRKADDTRSIRWVYIEEPRKNGKSVMAAVIGLYMFSADGEHGAEVYSGATSEKQAWEVFRPAKLLAQRAPAFREA